MTLDAEAFDAEGDELDAEEVGGPGNRIVGARARNVAEFLARQLVDDPDGIEIEVVEGRDREAKLVVRASQGDVGRLIGRRGRTVQALRQVARAAGAADDERIQLDVVD